MGEYCTYLGKYSARPARKITTRVADIAFMLEVDDAFPAPIHRPNQVGEVALGLELRRDVNTHGPDDSL